MDEEKEQILKEIDAKRKKIEHINMKIQCFTEVIAHLRSRVSKCETRKRTLHNEIIDLKDRVLAWQANSR